MAISKTDKEFLADANKRLGTKYKTVKEYLTDNGKRKTDSAGYKRREAALQNWRGTEKRSTFTESGQWIDYVTKRYGWLVNVYNTNPEVAQIIRDAYTNEWSEQEYADAINRSQWFTNLQVGEYDYLKGTFTNDRAYLDKIEQQVLGVKKVAQQKGYTISDEQAKLLAAGSLKGGWSAAQLDEEVGKRVTEQAQTGVTPVAAAPAGVVPTGLQKGNDAATVRADASAYGLKLTAPEVEGYVQSLVNGSLTREQVQGQFREQAKSLYPSIAKQLDAGDLTSATASYRSIASNVLGIDSSAVDFSDATKFGKLLTYQDPKSGEARLMNSTEWTQYLRGLPEWSNTKEAKDQYQSMIDTVNKIFGKVS